MGVPVRALGVPVRAPGCLCIPEAGQIGQVLEQIGMDCDNEA